MVETPPAPLHLTLFGPMAVQVNGHPLPRLRSRKALWLLALLTLRPDRPVEREWLAGTLWPDVGQEVAFANLRPVLSELRRALGTQGGRLWSPDRHTLQLESGGADIDVLTFDTAMQRQDRPALQMAVELYRGPLLEGCTEEWVFQERAAREQLCLQALHQLGESALADVDNAAAIGFYRRAIILDPLADSARRGLIDALARSGDINAALQVYRSFAEHLKREMNTVPDATTHALYSRLREGLRPRTDPPGAADLETAPPQRSLPHPITELVGREDERIEVIVWLGRSRLVTLTGPGGIGKTRLAVQVAAESARDYPDGVWLVALESLSEGRRVVPQISAVLGVREEFGRTPLQSLTDHLRGKRLLLVLDNCEQVREASAQAAGHLLRECPGVTLLATSREPLGVIGETAWAVPALATPDPKHLPQGHAALVRVLMSYESVRLFVERAQAVQRTFALTAANAGAVAEVCAHVEGIPLALELAAARVRSLTVEQIALRLHDHLGLLAGHSRTAPTRQQTLRATLDWSYALLAEAERTLLRRLAVFAGGWCQEAAERVCGGEGHGASEAPWVSGPQGFEPGQVQDLIGSLVDKSLVLFEERPGESSGRYRLLEVVRQYAAEQLQARGEGPSLQRRHRDWLAAWVAEVEPHLEGGDQEVWLRRLDTESDNLRAALTRAGEGAAAEVTDLQLAGALYRFWYVRGYWGEGREHLSRLLEEEAARGRTVERAKALHGAGSLAYSQGDYAAARAAHEESLSIRQERGDLQGTAWSLHSLGSIAYDQGDYTSAKVMHEESLRIRRELNDRRGIAWSLFSLGNIAHPQGDYSAARALYQGSLALLEEIGDRQGCARILSCLGYVALDQGEYAAASVQFEASHRLFQDLGDKGGVAWLFCCVGYLAFDQGEDVRAQELIEEGLGLFRELGDRRGIAWSLNSLGSVAQLQGNIPQARRLHEESLRLRQQLGDRQGMAWSLIGLGNVAHEQGDPMAAWRLLGEGLSLFAALGDRKGMAMGVEELAGVAWTRRQLPAAVRLRSAARAMRARIGAPPSSRERERSDDQLKQARSALGESAFAAAWEEGQALDWDRLVADALGDPPADP